VDQRRLQERGRGCHLVARCLRKITL
jgi:hypothetical protein